MDEPLTNSDPVITALPLNGNVVAVTPVNPVPSPLNDPVKEPVNGAVSEVNCVELEITPAGNVTVAFSAYDAVVANEAVDGAKVIDVAVEAVVANELDIALLAQLAVPIRFPSIPEEALIEVTTNPPVTINPFGNVMEPEKYDADTALVAQLLVPNNDAVILLVEKTLLVAVSNTKSVFGPGLPESTKFTLDAVTLPEIFNDPLMTTGPRVV